MDYHDSRLGDTSDNQHEQPHCSNCDGHQHTYTTITDQPCIATDKDNWYYHSLTSPQQPPNYKRQLSDNNDTLHVPMKKFKAHHQIVMIIPIMESRLQYNITTYSRWRRNGFDIVLVFNKDEEDAITSILKHHAPDMITSFKLHPYTTSIPSNAGIAKSEAYCILQKYLDLPQFMFALLLDDTVDDITNTSTGKSIMTSPSEFHDAVIKFAEESPIFGGTVAAKRHPDTCKQDRTATIVGAFLQQALVFSCRGTPTLMKHFNDIENYMMKMRKLSYRRVPFGEDIAFQIALYEHEILPGRKSAQFWGLGISRIKHVSTTNKPFDQLHYKTKEEIKEMIIYLLVQGALSINPKTNELRGVKVIPEGRIRIPVRGSKGERPWKEAFNYTFSYSKENIDVTNRFHF